MPKQHITLMCLLYAQAQMALNNCVLSNTTIFAESPAESEVQLILQHLGSGGGGAWRPGSQAGKVINYIYFFLYFYLHKMGEVRRETMHNTHKRGCQQRIPYIFLNLIFITYTGIVFIISEKAHIIGDMNV